MLSDEQYREEVAKESERENLAILEEKQRIQQLALAQEEDEKQKQAQAAADEEIRRKAAEEARKPTYFQGKIKKGDIIDAYYLGPVDRFNPKIKKFKLLINEPGKEQEIRLSYFGNLDEQAIHQVLLKSVNKKGKVESIEYKGHKS
jgi:hypothetical protein